MLDFLQSAASFVVAIGVLVAFHEFGHFWVARRFGIKVLKFSIGFGKPLWRRTGRDGVEYILAAIPLGGYVKLLDEREPDVVVAPEDLPHAFNRQPVWTRITVFAAGAVFNFILAIAFYWLLYVIGIPGMKPVIAEPAAGSLAAKAGLLAGEEVVAINADPIPTWTVLRSAVLDEALNRGVSTFTVRSADGSTRAVPLDFAAVRVDPVQLFADVGLSPYDPPIPPVIGEVVPGEAAAASGFLSGDRIIAIDGEAVASFQALRRYVSQRAGQVIKADVERNGARIELSAVVGSTGSGSEAAGRLGIGPQRMAGQDDLWQSLRAEQRLGPLAAVPAAFSQTWNISVLTLRLLSRMVTGEVSVKNVSGPIQIAQAAGYSASAGITAFIGFVALVSVSIGVFNLLPIPMLDGGQILYGLIEAVKGSPLSDRIQMMGQQVGLTLLVMLMGLAFYNDVASLIG